MSVDIVISMDSTGSMYPAIAELRRRMVETVNTLFSTIPDLRMGIIAHGDYNDYPYETTQVDLTANKDQLIQFIKTVQTTNGFGNGGEQYEHVMHIATTFDWKADQRAYILVGDEPAHVHGLNVRSGGKYFKVAYDWRGELETLQKHDIVTYVIRCLDRSDSKRFHAELSRLAGTPLLHLHQFANIVELVTALTYKQAGDTYVHEYALDLESKGMLNRNIASLIDSILCGHNIVGDFVDRVKPISSDLMLVNPTRFQVLHVDQATDIKSFVLSTGATFKKGRGFYQLTKREEIQERKEVILQDRSTGDFYTGDQARDMIGIPYGSRGNAGRWSIPSGYDAFVQSTSVNRKLMGNTRFLYDTEV